MGRRVLKDFSAGEDTSSGGFVPAHLFDARDVLEDLICHRGSGGLTLQTAHRHQAQQKTHSASTIVVGEVEEELFGCDWLGLPLWVRLKAIRSRIEKESQQCQVQSTK
jgi:hypothetical protein